MGDSLVLLPRSSLQSAQASKKKIRFFSESFRTPFDSFISKNEGMAKGFRPLTIIQPGYAGFGFGVITRASEYGLR
jgi:hypothetical protein